MRVRTDEKRQEIMDAASAVFSDMGYERTSMAAIARMAGASKQTLYSYFESKEDLFTTAMVEAMTAQADAMFSLLQDTAKDLRKTLEAYGRAYIGFVTSKEILKLTRVAVSEGGQAKLGPLFYARGPQRGWQALADSLQAWADQGLLVIPDSRIASLHLKGLLEAGAFEQSLYGAAPSIETDEAAREAVRVFLSAYGAQPTA